MLIRSVNSAAMQKRVRRFVEPLSHRFYSQGCREKTVQLPGGITLTLNVTYYHRSKDP